jgi:hypothetical protein
MNPYDRYRTFTRAYISLQGLRSLPIGLVILIVGLQRLGVNWVGKQGDCTITLPLLLIAIAAWFLIGRYYDHTFGKIEPAPVPLQEQRKMVAIPLILIAAIIIEIVLFRLDRLPPVSLIELTLGGAWIYFGWKTSRWYYLWSGVLSVLFSFSPLLTGNPASSPMFGSFGIAYNLFLGGAVVVTSLLDHLRLASSFQPLNGGSHAGNA